MSNLQMLNVMAGHYFDQLCDGGAYFEIGACDPSALQGSITNPLQALMLLCIDVESGMSFDSVDLAKVTGVPSSWFCMDRLVAPSEDVLKALGMVSLIYLSCLRNDALRNGFEVDVTENSLEAHNTFNTVLSINERLKNH